MPTNDPIPQGINVPEMVSKNDTAKKYNVLRPWKIMFLDNVSHSILTLDEDNTVCHVRHSFILILHKWISAVIAPKNILFSSYMFLFKIFSWINFLLKSEECSCCRAVRTVQARRWSRSGNDSRTGNDLNKWYRKKLERVDTMKSEFVEGTTNSDEM